MRAAIGQASRMLSVLMWMLRLVQELPRMPLHFNRMLFAFLYDRLT